MDISTESAEFSTETTGNGFIITIEQESDWSTDGGYTFEDVTNSVELTKDQCINLIAELKKFTTE